MKNCELDDIILKIANNLLLDLEKSEHWSMSNITPIPKKGELSKGGN